MMGLQGKSAVVGFAEWPSSRAPSREPMFELDQWSVLAAEALTDCGLSLADVDGLICTGLREAKSFAPSTLAEYLGCEVNLAERIDLGGAAATSMLGRAAMAVELGLCDVVLCAIPWSVFPSQNGPSATKPPTDYGTSSDVWGAPQAEFDSPYGNVGQNAGYAMVAREYAQRYDYDVQAAAKLTVDLRTNASTNPNAAFYGVPLSTHDYLASPMIADPLRMFDMVMPCFGGAAVVVTSLDRARSLPHRPCVIAGFGERVAAKTPTYAPDMLSTAAERASAKAFAMSSTQPADMDLVQLYDCYTISALLNLEAAGFCSRGESSRFVHETDLTWNGDFPLNTHGGQLGCGQPGLAGGLSLVVEAARQVMHRADGRQVELCDNAFVSGTGGIFSAQSALVLQGVG